jgi:hypothetical protein
MCNARGQRKNCPFGCGGCATAVAAGQSLWLAVLFRFGDLQQGRGSVEGTYLVESTAQVPGAYVSTRFICRAVRVRVRACCNQWELLGPGESTRAHEGADGVTSCYPAKIWALSVWDPLGHKTGTG